MYLHKPKRAKPHLHLYFFSRTRLLTCSEDPLFPETRTKRILELASAENLSESRVPSMCVERDQKTSSSVSLNNVANLLKGAQREDECGVLSFIYFVGLFSLNKRFANGNVNLFFFFFGILGFLAILKPDTGLKSIFAKTRLLPLLALLN